MENQNCGNCQFFQKDTDDHDLGHCRRHAPIVDDGAPAWPPVSSGCWCGEWSEIELPDAERCNLFGCRKSGIVSKSHIDHALKIHPGLDSAATDALKRLVKSGVGVSELLEMTSEQFANLKYCDATSAERIVDWIALHEQCEASV